MQINSAKELDVYKAAYDLAMRVFELTKHFPAEEKFALTSQIFRSSRSVYLNLREAWAKRRYEAHFISKLTDCDGENSETDSSWILPTSAATSAKSNTQPCPPFVATSARWAVC